MTLISLTLAQLKARALNHTLLVLLLALGVATTSALLHVSVGIAERLERDAQGIDLVVGAKGSPLQLVLSSVYHTDIPTGNIRLADAKRLMQHPSVKAAIPLALGDSYKGFRIVGTTPAYAARVEATLAEGEMFASPLQATLGADVARASGLGMGAQFAGSHGLTAGGDVHDATPYTVVGILKPTGTVLDRLILTPVESLWAVHEGHDHDHAHHKHHAKHDAHEDTEITALLIQFSNRAAAMSLPREINRNTPMQAASPALEITRLLSLLGMGTAALHAFAAVLIASAVLGMWVMLFQSVRARRAEFAMMRALGAKRSKVVAGVVCEALILLAAGVLLGLALSRVFMVLAPFAVPEVATLGLHATRVLTTEVVLAGAIVAGGLVVALLPAFKVYRMDVSRTLQDA